MNIDKWLGCYKVCAFQWIDGKTIYVNVQYFQPGQSIEQSPVWDRTIYLTDNANGRRIINEYLESFVRYIACHRNTEGTKVVITA